MHQIVRHTVRKAILMMPPTAVNLIPRRIRTQLDLPLDRWEYQLNYWESWFENEGGVYSISYLTRIHPERRQEAFPAFVEPFLADLANEFPGRTLRILDVGSGPISPLIWGHEVGRFHLTCIDALGDEYRELFTRYQIAQPLPIAPVFGEDMACEGEYHVVFSKNALDHCLEPATVFGNMVRATEVGGYVIIWSYVNEGSAMQWSGGHQHNLDLVNDHLLLTNKQGERRNLTESLPLEYAWSTWWEGHHSGEFQVVYKKLGNVAEEEANNQTK